VRTVEATDVDPWQDRVVTPNEMLFPNIAVNLESRIGYGCRLRLRGKLAVVLDRPGGARVFV